MVVGKASQRVYNVGKTTSQKVKNVGKTKSQKV